MQDSGRGLWSQDHCSDTINVTPQPLEPEALRSPNFLPNFWEETDRVSPEN